MSVSVFPDCECCPIESGAGSGSGCAIDGWGGPGWYCILFGGSCVVVELIAEDECNDLIIICRGPYATEAEALAACSPTDVQWGPCCGNGVYPNVLRATPRDGTPPFFLVAPSGVGQIYTGEQVFNCGARVRIDVIPASCLITGRCFGTGSGPGSPIGNVFCTSGVPVGVATVNFILIGGCSPCTETVLVDITLP